jgi:transporter family protein
MSWVAYAGLSALFAGLVAIFGKIGVRGVDSTLATTIRAAIMFGALATIVLARGATAEITSIDRRTLLRLSGAVTLVLAALLLRERAPMSAWIGTGLMLLGAVIVARS